MPCGKGGRSGVKELGPPTSAIYTWPACREKSEWDRVRGKEAERAGGGAGGGVMGPAMHYQGR